MNICGGFANNKNFKSFHEEIVFEGEEGDECPLCRAKKEIELLNKQVEDLLEERNEP